MAYRNTDDADDLFAWEASRQAEGWAPLAGYTDVNGNQFASFDEACRYYGADTPAQVEAEEAYWAAEEEADRRVNDALVYTAAPRFWDDGLDLGEDCPF